MSNQITLEEISRTGVMGLVNIAYSLKLPDKLQSIIGDDFTKEIGDLSPDERKVAVFIHHIGNLTVAEGYAQNPYMCAEEITEELLEHTNNKPLGKRINALYAYLFIAIQIRHNMEVDGNQDIYWDAKGKIYVPLTSFICNTEKSTSPN